MNLNRGGGAIVFMAHNIYYKNVTKKKFTGCGAKPNSIRVLVPSPTSYANYEPDFIAKLPLQYDEVEATWYNFQSALVDGWSFSAAWACMIIPEEVDAGDDQLLNSPTPLLAQLNSWIYGVVVSCGSIILNLKWFVGD